MREAVFLEPFDVWSFRDAKPFEAGESFEASSIFPPHPWTVLGCLRTALLRRLCPDPERYAGRGGEGPCPRCGEGPCAAEPAVGKAGEEAPFTMGPPLLARLADDGQADVFFPAPRDLVLEVVRDDPPSEYRPRLLTPVEVPRGVAHSLGRVGPAAAPGPARVESWRAQWLRREELLECLAGRPPAADSARGPCVLRESRIGVGIDPSTRSAQRGQLYLRDTVRLEEGVQARAGLLVEVGARLELDGETGRLGGDGRMVAIRRVTAPDPVPAPEAGPRLKVYLASPTWFEKGWRPGWLDPGTLEGTVPGTGTRVRLVGAATGDPALVGGWDLKAQRPRPLRAMVPAGAVYFLEVVAGDPGEVAAALHARPLCDDGAMARAGFGLALLGRY
jgi:CRISPR-associated protein Cmr3